MTIPDPRDEALARLARQIVDAWDDRTGVKRILSPSVIENLWWAIERHAEVYLARVRGEMGEAHARFVESFPHVWGGAMSAVLAEIAKAIRSGAALSAPSKDMRAEIDFAGGVRGKYHARFIGPRPTTSNDAPDAMEALINLCEALNRFRRERDFPAYVDVALDAALVASRGEEK